MNMPWFPIFFLSVIRKQFDFNGDANNTIIDLTKESASENS